MLPAVPRAGTGGRMREISGTEMVRLRLEGLTLQEIADRAGVSKQRVHQVLTRPVDSIIAGDVYLALRERLLEDWACTVCGKEERRSGRALRAHTCSRECRARLNGKRSDEELLSALATLAAELGRTPTTEEVNASSLTPGQPVYHRRFGSLSKAQKLVGLKPRKPGQRLAAEEQKG